MLQPANVPETPRPEPDLKAGAVWALILLALIALTVLGAAERPPNTAPAAGKLASMRLQIEGAEGPPGQTALAFCTSQYACLRRGCVSAVLVSDLPDLLWDAIAQLCAGVPVGERMQLRAGPANTELSKQLETRRYAKSMDLWFGLERI